MVIALNKCAPWTRSRNANLVSLSVDRNPFTAATEGSHDYRCYCAFRIPSLNIIEVTILWRTVMLHKLALIA